MSNPYFYPYYVCGTIMHNVLCTMCTYGYMVCERACYASHDGIGHMINAHWSIVLGRGYP